MTPEENDRIREALRTLSVDRSDDDAWRSIIDLTFPIALATANRILRGTLDLAKDATWEAFARIARYADFQLMVLIDPDAFVRYLKQVTRRAAYDLLRSLARKSPEMQSGLVGFEEGIQGSEPTPEETMAAGELRSEIMDVLNPDEKNLLNFVLEGFSAAEIGRLLEISSDAAGVRLHRLREKIRNYLKPKGI